MASAIKTGNVKERDRPLTGVKFFFDTSPQNMDIEKLVRTLGGRIETFLWKNVDYLVTESTTSVIKKPQGGKLPSNAHTHFTRAQKMVASAKHSSSSNTNNNLSTVERAKTMGIRIISPKAILKWRQQLQQLKNKTNEKKDNLDNNNNNTIKHINKNKNNNNNTKKRQVTIKVEDNSKLYQPEMKILKTGFPEMDYTGFGGSPFDYQSAYNLRSNKQAHPNTCKLTTAIEAESKRVHALENKAQESGYCELCHLKFNNRAFHLRGRIHHSNIESKYDSLDQLINNGGQSFDSFIRHHGDEDADDKEIPCSDITVNAISPIQLSVKQGHGLVRRRKRKHEDANLSNQSSVESIDPQAVIPIVGKRKFVALETKRYVAIAHLQQRLRRAERADGERGSTLVDVPTFESDSMDFERICTAPKNITQRLTRQTKSTITRSKQHVKLRRSRRLINESYGTRQLRVPVLVAEAQQR